MAKKKYTYFISYHWQSIESSYIQHTGFGNVTIESDVIVPLGELQEVFGTSIKKLQSEPGDTTIIILFSQYDRNK